MVMPSFETQARRDAEHAAARTAADVAILQKKWQQEDAELREREEREPEEHANAAQLARHERRLAVLERRHVPPDLMMDVVRFAIDVSELRGWTSIVKRLDPARGAELVEILQKGFDREVPQAVGVQFADAAVAAINGAIKRGIDEALAARPQLKYRGTWQQDTLYVEGNITTHAGGMWFCQRETMARPDVDHESWQLCVKSGKNGRDLRNDAYSNERRISGVTAHKDDPDYRSYA